VCVRTRSGALRALRLRCTFASSRASSAPPSYAWLDRYAELNLTFESNGRLEVQLRRCSSLRGPTKRRYDPPPPRFPRAPESADGSGRTGAYNVGSIGRFGDLPG